MGNGISCVPRYGCCVPRAHPDRCKENHTKFSTSTPHRSLYGNGTSKSSSKSHRRNLSAAFNMADLEFTAVSNGNGVLGGHHNGGAGDYHTNNAVVAGSASDGGGVELLNVNVATEEELMTLPGVNRHTAHNIVEYRKQIGIFKKVEDLALVSGVGATKLRILQPEICVRKGTKSSSSSSASASSSRQDLSMNQQQDTISRSSTKSGGQPQLYNINTSNVFQLMKVKGISQTLAEFIVMHREKKGPYRTVDDLLKVKGFKPYVFSAVRQNLTVDEVPPPPQTPATTTTTSNYVLQDTGINITCNPSQTNLLSASADSQEDMISLYGPLTKKSFRGGKRKQHYFTKRNGRPVMRIGSWNLQQCGEDKSTNPGVKEVVAMTILENGLGIVGVQELGDTEALQKLCDELNQPSIPAVRKFQGHRGIWKCVTSQALPQQSGSDVEHLGFLYDSSRGVELRSTSLLENTAAHTPYVANFRLREFDVSVVNVHLRNVGAKEGDVTKLLDAIEQHLQPDATDLVILGDFNSAPEQEGFSALRERGYHNVLASDKYTNISMRNPEGSACFHNVWLHPHTSKVYTGSSDVIREGLTSPWIPDGWGWGGLASAYCPLWAELYTDADFGGDGGGGAGDGNDTPLPHNESSISVKDIQCALKMGMVGAEL